MVIDISKLTEKAPLDIYQQYTLDGSLGVNLQQASPVQVSGQLAKQLDRGGDLFIFTLTVTGGLTFVCDKCTEPATHQLSLTLHEHIKKPEDIKQPDEDSDVYWLSNTKLDIGPLLVTYLYDSLPMQILCTPDCQGLCNSCGCRLNQESCSCVEQAPETDARFDILKTLTFD